MQSNVTSLRKCALLVVALGEECAAEVVKHLSSAELQSLSTAIAATKHATRAEVNDVLKAFRDESSHLIAITLGSNSYISEMLTRALGPDRAAGILEDILDQPDSNKGIDALNALDPSGIAELISEEHPQIIATILVHLDRERASGVLTLLSERLRNDVVLRIATFGGVQPTALAELTDVLNGVLSGQSTKRSKMGGVRTAAEILNAMKGNAETQIIAMLRQQDAELAQRVEDEMFVFDHLAGMDGSAIQNLLREVDSTLWTIALKGAKQEVVDHILVNMSARQAEFIREELSDQGPLRVSVVEAAQKQILVVARRLVDEGVIMLNSAGDDAYV